MGCGASKSDSAIEIPSHANASPNETMNSPATHSNNRSNSNGADSGANLVRMLLLGAGESGKSTIFKQMRILYGAPRTEDEIFMYAVVIRSNIIVAIKKLCSRLVDLGLEDRLSPAEKEAFDEVMAKIVENNAGALGVNGAPNQAPVPFASASQESANAMQQGYYNHKAGLIANQEAELFLENWKLINTVWQSDVMKEVWQQRAPTNVIDGHKLFLDSIETIANLDFRPTNNEILLARVRTTQVTCERYTIDGVNFELFDVGGQRAERKKWIDTFDNVDAVIFVAALSEYDQNLAEARRTNRMVEAIELFRSVCNNRSFTNTPVLLFLNKKDIFAEKLLTSDIAAQRPFSDYRGPPRDFDGGVNYFKTKFEDCINDPDYQDSFIHVTKATDTDNMQFVLNSTRSIIMTENLKRSGLLG